MRGGMEREKGAGCAFFSACVCLIEGCFFLWVCWLVVRAFVCVCGRVCGRERDLAGGGCKRKSNTPSPHFYPTKRKTSAPPPPSPPPRTTMDANDSAHGGKVNADIEHSEGLSSKGERVCACRGRERHPKKSKTR